MSSRAAERFAGGGGGGGEEHLFHHPMYHVPQHSRREKLRFHPQEDYPPPPSLLLLHDPSIAPQLFSPNTPAAASFLPTTSCSSSHYPTYSPGPATQFTGSSYSSLAPPQDHHQIPHHGFYLSLSSPSSSAPPPARCHQPGIGFVFDHGAPRISPAPLGPFTGYAAVLNRSRFLEPARQLLEEICDVGKTSLVKASRAGRGGGNGRGGDVLLDGEPPELSPPLDHEIRSGPVSGAEQQWKKTRLISMLDEVYKRYKYYYQQVQAVITSFESVAGLTTAAPYGTMALKAMLKHFRCLKNMISHQLRNTNKVLGKEGHSGGEIASFGLLNSGGCLQRTANNSGSFGQPHVWRPQRGLPERAVAVLRSWLFEHFLHPYPTDADKQMLAKQTGLTRNQVSNWFINARVRLWKPMVEEIHNLEMRQLHKASASDKNHNSNDQAPHPSASTATPSGSLPANNVCTQKNDHALAKSMQNDLTQIPNHIHEPFNFGYDDLSSHQQIGMESSAANVGNGGVSLTLGLHQNNGVCIGEQLPFSVARRFGLDECSDAYVIGTFEGQDRQFSKDIGGHLLHDFVG